MNQEHQKTETKSRDEVYSISDAQAQREYVENRTAAKWVGFFLPHLRAGMRLLDCGCGVGSITLDLAEVVAPGQVVGIDTDAEQLDIAHSQAQKRGITNVRFELGSVSGAAGCDCRGNAVMGRAPGCVPRVDVLRGARLGHRGSIKEKSS